ncbi:sensor histidine kinase [Chryseobacterium sp. JK1]|uniref:sensor histidine kinase n=1 Tax=Chryseobacterium sp. JK1 TaxID=874294 RepID=UPI003D690831
MKKQTQYSIAFTGLIIALSIIFQYIILKIQLGDDGHITSLSAATSTLACIFFGFFDVWIVRNIIKKYSSYLFLKVMVISLAITSLTVLCVSISAHFLILDTEDFKSRLFDITVPAWLLNCILVFLIAAYYYAEQKIRLELQLMAREKEKAQYQYEILKSQLNPHFLFNSLNALSYLVYEDPTQSNLFIKKLAGLYRYVLHAHTKELITLKEELKFVESYFFLEKIRFDSIFLTISGSDHFGQRKIIPLSLQILVENAIKHNVSDSDAPLKITITIDQQGISVYNPINSRTQVKKNGIGLENLEKQHSAYDKHLSVNHLPDSFSVHIPFIE